VARVVEFGLCTRLPARMKMRLRWACSGGHGAVPAGAGCPMILGLYGSVSVTGGRFLETAISG
jgi:hypothetical protein